MMNCSVPPTATLASGRGSLTVTGQPRQQYPDQQLRAGLQEAVRRADRAAAEAAALRGELAAVQAAVEAGDPAAASAAQQQVRLSSHHRRAATLCHRRLQPRNLRRCASRGRMRRG